MTRLAPKKAFKKKKEIKSSPANMQGNAGKMLKCKYVFLMGFRR